jgi:hypothetical protein
LHFLVVLIEVLDIGGMMFAIVVGKGLFADVGHESGLGVRERVQSKGFIRL